MKRVFICSPLRGDIQGNIEKANEYCRWAMTEHGALPIAPHVYFTQFLDELNPAERERGISAGIELLRDCDELWYFGDRVTEGMAREIGMARRIGLPVSHIDSGEINQSENHQNLMEVAI